MRKLNIFPYLIDFLPFLLQVLSLYVYAILLEEFRHSMVLGKSNTKVPKNIVGPLYIYIYIYTFIKKKQQTGHIRIINLFPSCSAFLKNQKTRKKINRTSSDLMDKINQNWHRKEGWEGIEEGGRVISSFSPLPFFHFILLSVRIIVN